MAECVPFIKVKDIPKTITWYQDIGFSCVATNLIWEPDCELNWARLEWEGAAFMLGPDESNVVSRQANFSLWFNVDVLEVIMEKLKSKSVEMSIEPETFYGRMVVSFTDLNGCVVAFSCALKK